MSVALRPQKPSGLLGTGKPRTATSTFTQLLSSAISLFQASRSDAMATASVPTEPNEKECSVCHEPFTEPKLLPCGHLMCHHCLLSWLKSQNKCPLCRGQIVEAEVRGKKSLEEIADGFPTDLGMKMVVDADRVLNKGHSCCVCEDVAATALCLTAATCCVRLARRLTAKCPC